MKDIPKTIIYIDSKPKIIQAQSMLTLYAHQHRGFTKEAARKVIQRFDADVRDADKDIIFGNLAGDTDCRIVFATGGLGMGTDLGDVARVVQFNPPRDVLARSKDASLRKKWLRYSLTKIPALGGAAKSSFLPKGEFCWRAPLLVAAATGLARPA